MKRFCLLLTLFLVLNADNVFTHEKGDLILNIEPQLGAVLPSETLRDNNMAMGFGLSLRTTVDYYFFDSLAFNAGVGVGASHHFFEKKEYSGDNALLLVPAFGWIFWLFSIDSNTEHLGEYFPIYITIPFGLRFSSGIFTIGAGATANIPLLPGGEDYNTYGYWNKNEEVTFKLLSYMGWYADIGVDFPNKKREKNSFGLLLRLNGSFQKAIADVYSGDRHYPVNDFNFFSVDLVFKFSIGLATIPIGGKK